MADQRERGLFEKYKVRRTDGEDGPGGRHEGCEYFVLDLSHDPFALPAILAYAAACEEEYPALAFDLFEKADAIAEKALDAASQAASDENG